MKRALEEEGEIIDENKTPVMKSILQRVAANMLAKSRAGPLGEPTGELIQETRSPETPMNTRAHIKPKQIFPKSTFWIKQLGKNLDEDEEIQADERAITGNQNQTRTETGTLKKKTMINPFKIEDWSNIELGLSDLKAVDTKNILEILSRVQAEKTLGGNVDPITNKLGHKFARRAFYVKEWEKQLHKNALASASQEIGMPFSSSIKQLEKLTIEGKKVDIKINLSIVSSADNELMDLYKQTTNVAEKEQIFSILLFNYALSLNCLRPQTGKTSFINHNQPLKMGKNGEKSKIKTLNKLMQEPRSENSETHDSECTEGISLIQPQQHNKKTRSQKTVEITFNENNTRDKIILLYSKVYFRANKMRPTIKIYMEMLEEVNTDEERIKCTDYLIKECKIVTDQLKADAEELNNAKRYWKDKGAKEKENGRNEIANAIYRLIVMFESITDYLTEMNRWWRKERIIIPLFGNFYNGPENSAFLASVIGLKDAEERKQNQTRLGFIELEIATQFINIAAGRNKTSWETFNVKTNKTKLLTTYKNRPHITGEFMLTPGMDTQTLHHDTLIIHIQGETKTIKGKYPRLLFRESGG